MRYDEEYDVPEEPYEDMKYLEDGPHEDGFFFEFIFPILLFGAIGFIAFCIFK
jgi:hypothetical protein